MPSLTKTNRTISPWFICCSAALLFLFVFFQQNSFNVISADLMYSFDMNPVQLGKLASLYLLAQAIVYLPIGILLDRYSVRKILLLSMGLAIWATAIFATSRWLIVASIARILLGMVQAVAFLGCLQLVQQWLPQQRALAIGVVSMISFCGGLLAQAPLSWLAENLGWRYAMLISAGIGLFLWLIMWMFVKDRPNQELRKIPLSQLKALKKVCCSRQNWLCAFFISLPILPVTLLGAVWGGTYLIVENNLSILQYAQVTGFIFIGLMLGVPFIGWLSDTLKTRKKIMLVGASMQLVILSLLNFSGMFSFIYLIIAFLLLGVFSGVLVLGYAIVQESNPPERVGIAVAFAAVVVMLVGSFAQILFGYLMSIDWQSLISNNPLSNYQSAFLLFPLAIGLAIIIAYFITDTGTEESGDK